MASKRSPYDFYATPPEAIDALLKVVRLEGPILEPCAGDGAIIDAIRWQDNGWSYIHAIDIDESHHATLQEGDVNYVEIRDVLTLTAQDVSDFSTVITNPPFSIAQEIIEHIFAIAEKGTKIYMLLRLNFLGSQKRHEFWKKYPPQNIYVLSKRPSFTGNGTDSQEYAWFEWTAGCFNEDRIRVIK